MVNAPILMDILNTGATEALDRQLAEWPDLPRTKFVWRPCGIGPSQPLSYLAQARFNGLIRHDRSGELAKLLLAHGAPVDGQPGDGQTPLITAASYREQFVAAALIKAGANLEATGYAVKGGTALRHAVEFGAPEIVSMLAAGGARVGSLAEAAGVGVLARWPVAGASGEERSQALRAAVLCERIPVMDELLSTGLNVNDLISGGTPLHWAAWEAKTESARHLVARGSDHRLVDPEHKLTALGWAKHRFCQFPDAHPGGHAEVIAFLRKIGSATDA